MYNRVIIILVELIDIVKNSVSIPNAGNINRVT